MEQIKSTALLVMDMQNTIVGTLPDNAAIVSNVSKAIVAARQNGIPVIYVVVGFRKDLPEISPNNKSFAGIRSGLAVSNLTISSAYIPAWPREITRLPS